MSDGRELLALARRFLPAGLAVAWADPTADWPDDPQTPPRAVPRRRAEFAAGRHAARTAFAQLGQPLPLVPVGADRAPIWPPGWTGSITHSALDCLAAVGPLAVIAGIGLDLEVAKPLSPDLWDSILCPAEMDWLTRQPEQHRAEMALRIFSAKEAAFKAQYATTRALFGFHSLRVLLHAGGFAARFLHPVPPFFADHTLTGHQAAAEGQILSIVVIAA